MPVVLRRKINGMDPMKKTVLALSLFLFAALGASGQQFAQPEAWRPGPAPGVAFAADG